MFRVDANQYIGMGHLMRCITLALELKKQHHQVAFIYKKSTFDLTLFIENIGFSAYPIIENTESLAEDALKTSSIISCLTCRVDWLIIDNYKLSEQFERSLKKVVGKIMIIDDLANRKHDCDLLLDQNIFCLNRYDNLVPKYCTKLIGSEFSLLRNEFLLKRNKSKRSLKSLKHILVNFGGGDDKGLIIKAVEAIASLKISDITCDVIIGQANPHKDELVESLANNSFIRTHTHVSNISDYMNLADLAIGSGGSSIWERCCLGLPSIITAITDIEEELAIHCQRKGLLKYIGKHNNVYVDNISTAMKHLLNHPKELQLMSEQGRKVVDGLGAKLVVQKMVDLA